MSSGDGIFMSIAAALGPESKSFEEVRIEDYIKAYQTNAGPPLPVPQEPTDEFQRKTLNLPPLFKPQTMPAAGPSSSLTSSSSLLSTSSGLTPSKLRIVNPAEIPISQEFRLYSVAGEKYNCISCIPEYEFYSPEELRYYAYFRGNKTAPVPVIMDPFEPLARDTAVGTTVVPGEDKLQSLCAQPEYSRHSPEELRVAYLLTGREMTSAELLPLPLQTPTISPLAPLPITTTTLAPVPQPIFASAIPSSAPKFSFGFL